MRWNILLICLVTIQAWAMDPTVEDFEQWRCVDTTAGDPQLEQFVKDGWIGGDPPYLLPQADFQTGPAKIIRLEGLPGKDVVSGKYALRLVTGKNPVNILSQVRTTVGNRSRKERTVVSAWLRGQGTVRFRIYAYDNTPRAVDTPFIATFQATPEWKQYRALYEPGKPEIACWGVVLEVSPDTSVDIDDIAISPTGGKEIVKPKGVPSPVEDSEKVAVAFPLQGAVAVDGRLDEPVWQKAEWHTGFLRHNNQDSLSLVQAQFAFLYDAENLYFGFACAETDLDTATIKPTSPGQWPDGRPLEIFLDPGATRDVYYQFGANITGGAYRGMRFEPSWDGSWKYAGARDDTGWTIEIAIPFSSLKRAAPKPGELWSVNVCRNGPYMGPWAPVGGAYHTPERFGLLTFGTYGQWWTEGIIPWEADMMKQLKERASVGSDASLTHQVKIAEETATGFNREISGKKADEFTRADFLNLFQSVNQVKTMLENVSHEASWLEAIRRSK